MCLLKRRIFAYLEITVSLRLKMFFDFTIQRAQEFKWFRHRSHSFCSSCNLVSKLRECIMALLDVSVTKTLHKKLKLFLQYLFFFGLQKNKIESETTLTNSSSFSLGFSYFTSSFLAEVDFFSSYFYLDIAEDTIDCCFRFNIRN